MRNLFLKGLVILLSWGGAGQLAACVVDNPAYCLTSDTCPANAPWCAPSHRCMASLDLAAAPDLAALCSSSSACEENTPICDATLRECRACQASSDDEACRERSSATPRCTSAGHCAACRAATQQDDCPATQPICRPEGTCAPCISHDECPSLVCLVDGSCAPAANVLYADKQNCAANPDGSRAKPWCEISDALAHLNGRAIVRVMGSSTPYQGVHPPGGENLLLVGPGQSSATSLLTSALLYTADQQGLLLDGEGGQLTLDGFEVRGGSGLDGIACQKTGTTAPALTVRRSFVHDSGGAGIMSSGCAVTIDQSEITRNPQGGLQFFNTAYAITNSFIVGNFTVAASFSSFSAGVFRHNTIAQNSASVGGAVFDCGNPIAPRSLENSLLWSNSGASLFTGNCLFTYIDAPEVLPGTGNRSLAPHFVNAAAGDCHLDPNQDNTCCIDQIPWSPLGYDIDGRTRPQRLSWDIGAHEVP